MAFKCFALTPFAAHDIVRIACQAIDEQQVRTCAFLAQGSIKAGGDFESFPGRRPLAAMSCDFGAHLRIAAASRSDKENSLEGGRQRLRIAALSAARAS